MPNLATKCDCGKRTIRFGKGAKYGDTWTCNYCDREWTYVKHGDRPLHWEKSLPPSKKKGSMAGTLTVLAIIGVVLWLIAA